MSHYRIACITQPAQRSNARASSVASAIARSSRPCSTRGSPTLLGPSHVQEGLPGGFASAHMRRGRVPPWGAHAATDNIDGRGGHGKRCVSLTLFALVPALVCCFLGAGIRQGLLLLVVWLPQLRLRQGGLLRRRCEHMNDGLLDAPMLCAFFRTWQACAQKRKAHVLFESCQQTL